MLLIRPPRPRRSCLAVPGSSPKMMAKAGTLPADMIFFDLEDAVASGQKPEARTQIVRALRENEYLKKVKAVRINAVDTHFCYRDIIEVVEGAGDRLDCLIIPKVEEPRDVHFVDRLLTQIERTQGWEVGRIGLEVQVESARGLIHLDQTAAASPRLETLIFGPGDLAADLGLPQLTIGQIADDYPGDAWHYVLMRVLIAARAHHLQVIDGPSSVISDLENLKTSARRSAALGFDGKWAIHPSQIEILNEIFIPRLADYKRAHGILAAYQVATAQKRQGAVMYEGEMIDEASRKMAAVLVKRGDLFRLDKELEQESGEPPHPSAQ